MIHDDENGKLVGAIVRAKTPPPNEPGVQGSGPSDDPESHEKALERARRDLRRRSEDVQRLEAAVRPFVAFADTIKGTPPGPYPSDDHVLLERTSLETGEMRQLTAGDFRAAYALAMGTDQLRRMRRELVLATIAEMRRLDGTGRTEAEIEWSVLQAVLGEDV